MKFRFAWLLLALPALGCGEAVAPVASEEAPPAEVLTYVDAEPAEFNPTGAPVVEFQAPGMHCEMCAASVVKALEEKPGVIDVRADAETKVVKVAVSEDAFDKQSAFDTIDGLGFGPADDEPAEEPSPDDLG